MIIQGKDGIGFQNFFDKLFVFRFYCISVLRKGTVFIIPFWNKVQRHLLRILFLFGYYFKPFIFRPCGFSHAVIQVARFADFYFALVFFFKVKSFDIAEGNPFIGQLFFYGIYVCQIIVSVGIQYSRNFSGCNGKNIFFVIGYFSSFFIVIVAADDAEYAKE